MTNSVERAALLHSFMKWLTGNASESLHVSLAYASPMADWTDPIATTKQHNLWSGCHLQYLRTLLNILWTTFFFLQPHHQQQKKKTTKTLKNEKKKLQQKTTTKNKNNNNSNKKKKTKKKKQNMPSLIYRKFFAFITPV